jgi:gluconolactonase
MRPRPSTPSLLALLGSLLVVASPPATASGPVPRGTPDAVIDLGTRDGIALVDSAWRYHDAEVVPIEFPRPGPDRKPSGAPGRTFDVEPHAGAADFDDAGWEVIDPTTLDQRRGGGRVSFNWYRLRLRIPERVGDFDPTGATVVFQVTVDDYAEVWVDGALPWVLGQSGGTVIGGFNTPNRVVLTRDARPGQTIQVALFGINGPISLSPTNYIWVRGASLEFHRGPRVVPALAVPTRVERFDPALDAIVAPGTALEHLAEGFQFTEGPLWRAAGGDLLFSDPTANRIYRWSADDGLSVFREQSGYAGTDVADYGQPGSNGLAVDPQGRLTIAEHGNHRISRLEPNGTLTVLADRYQGQRLNSPNDLVYRSDGALYFSDPPFGLPRFFDDPRKELPWSGVFLWKDGVLSAQATDLTGPNGLAFSPDERFLYVTNWDERRKVVMRYAVRADGTLGTGATFFDMGTAPEPEALDGIKVDGRGNLFVSGPGGLWIIAPSGTHLGTVRGPELPANMAWGDDGRTLYLTARTGLYRLRLREAGTPGLRLAEPSTSKGAQS